MTEKSSPHELIFALAEAATQALRQERAKILDESTAVRHQVLSRLVTAALEEAEQSGRPAVRAWDGALTRWADDNYFVRKQESGRPAGTGQFSSPESSIKQWYSEIGRPWIKDIELAKGDWYRAQLDLWHKDDSFYMAWRFFGLRYAGEQLKIPERNAEAKGKASAREVTRPNDALEVGWFSGLPPSQQPPEEPYIVRLTEADLVRAAEHFHSFCARLRRTGTFVYPKKKKKSSEPRITVVWPRKLRVTTLAVVAALLFPSAVLIGCYQFDRSRKAALMHDMTISAGAICNNDRGRPAAFVSLQTGVSPPMELTRDDSVVGEMQATRLPNSRWQYQFWDNDIVSGRDYSYRAAKRMWGTGERLYSSRVGATAPVCRAGNRPPSVQGIRALGTATVGRPSSFEVSGLNDPDADPLTIMWNFGDSTVKQQGAVAVHTYSQPGPKIVAIAVHDDVGGVTTASVEINVLPSADGVATPVDTDPGTTGGRVSPKVGSAPGTEFTLIATPVPEALTGCTSPTTYQFTVENSTAGAVVDSPWLAEPQYRVKLYEPGAWHITYRIRCGDELRGPYSFGLSDFASVRN